ncbi:SPASM domain-containing protein [Algoriphagus halophilus]
MEKEPLLDVWKSPAYQLFRNQLLADRSQIDICQNCTQ